MLHHFGHHGRDGEGRRFHRGDPRLGHHPRGGRGGGRFFETGDLRLVILRLIAERPRHGYELIKAIEEGAGGAYAPSPGVVYPTLTLLEELGQIAVQATEGARKLYAATPEGERVLEASRAETDAVFARMEAASAGRPGGGGMEVMRAVQNFRTALRMRMARGGLTEDQVRRIVTVIDEAAVQVERVR